MTHITDLNKGPGHFTAHGTMAALERISQRPTGEQWREHLRKHAAKADGDRQHRLAHELADVDRLAIYANPRDGGMMPEPDRGGNAAMIVVLCAAVSLPGIWFALQWWL
jgi:hypothetical protein